MSDAHLPADALDDIAYVRAAFRPLDGLNAKLVERGLLPQATYVLPDGTEMVPETHGSLLADGFRERFLAAGGRAEDVEDELDAWLGGGYGACLLDPSPETIVAKGALMTAIEALLARPEPADAALRGAVDALDALERPFAAHDRERFGGPVSRDRLITAPRERFPEIWSEVP
jgi:Family of unknown function (DUF6058)